MLKVFGIGLVAFSYWSMHELKLFCVSAYLYEINCITKTTRSHSQINKFKSETKIPLGLKKKWPHDLEIDQNDIETKKWLKWPGNLKIDWNTLRT